MHDAEKRKVAWFHYQQGKAKKEIARLLGIDVKAVKRFIEHRGELPKWETPSRIFAAHQNALPPRSSKEAPRARM